MDNERAAFTDLTGTEWEIRLDAPLVRRVEQVCGIRLTDLKADPFFRLSTDPLLLVDVLWLLCEKQAKQNGITDQEFGERLGDQIDAAVAALEVGILNFCHSSKRSLLRSLIRENESMTSEAMTAAMEDLKANRTRTVQAMARTIRARVLASIDSSTSDSGPSATS